MEKSLRDLLLGQTEGENQNPRTRSRCLFLKYWPQIRELLDEGFPLSKIHATLLSNSRLNISYGGLRRQVVKMRKRDLEGRNTITPEEIPRALSSQPKIERKNKAAPTIEQPVTTVDPVPTNVYFKPPEFGRRRHRDGDELF